MDAILENERLGLKQFAVRPIAGIPTTIMINGD
jgi:hypothetical protein